MGKPKKQHWVPQFYLRHFATPETRHSKEPKVWIFSKDEGDPSLTSIKNVAQRRYLYSPKDTAGNRLWDLEDKLSDIESLLTPIWGSLAEGLIDLHGETAIRKGLALFISLLHLRHPRRLAEVQRIHAQLVEFYEQCPKDKHGNPDVGEIEVNGIWRPFDASDWPRYKDANAEDKKQMFVDAVRQNAVHDAELLMKKRWSVVFSEDPVFITTDTPVAVLHTSREIFGLGTPGTIVSFPISPTRVLMMDDRHDEPVGQYYPLAETGPGPSNITAWHACDRLMISPRHTDQVCAEMLAWGDRQPSVQEV